MLIKYIENPLENDHVPAQKVDKQIYCDCNNYIYLLCKNAENMSGKRKFNSC